MQRMILLAFALALTLLAAFAQSRSDLARRFGPPQTESFLVRPTLKLSATYDLNERVCTFREERPELFQWYRTAGEALTGEPFILPEYDTAH